MLRVSRAAAVALIVGAVACAGAIPASAQGSDDSSVVDEADAIVTAVDVRPLNPTQPVLGSDGRVHLAYELLISNLSDKVVDVESIEVLDPSVEDEQDAVVTTIPAATLATTMRIYGADTSTTIPAGSGATLFVDVALDKDDPVPARLDHRFTTTLAAPPTAGEVQATGTDTEPQEFVGGEQRVIRTPAVVVAPPLEGDRWVVGNGCCAEVTAHRAATLPIDGTIHVPERYAIDFVQLDTAGRMFNGDLADNDSYPYYGDNILAVAPGTVVRVQDGLEDETPGELPADATVQSAGGNYVVVDIGNGRYAFYAHMIPDSQTVKVGDKVATGDVLGHLGNSGNTDGAHLHFHIMDGPSPLTSNGLPFVFTEFSGEGSLGNLDAVQHGTATAEIDPKVNPGRHRHELPLNLEVIDFPEAKG